MPLNQVSGARRRSENNDRRRRNAEDYARRVAKREAAAREARQRAARKARREAREEGLNRRQRRQAGREAKREVRREQNARAEARQRAAKRANYKTRTNQGTKVRLGEDGYVSKRYVAKRGLVSKSADKLNNVIDREKLYLTPGKGRAVVDTRTIRYLDDEGGKRKETVNIYKRFLERRRRGGRGRDGEGGSEGPGSSGGSSSSSSGSGSGSSSYSSPSPSAEPTPPSYYESSEPGGIAPPGAPVNPNFSPTGAPYGTPTPPGRTPIYWDSTPEGLTNYTDRLNTFNYDTNRWLGDIADQDRYESGRYLRNFASALPPAPDPSAANDDVLDFLKRANRELGFSIA